MDIISGIKSSFKNGGTLTKLIYINVAIFIVAWLVNSFAPEVIDYFMLPAHGMRLLTQPWSLVSYMFLHTEFMHILLNMLWLYWFGQLFVNFISQKQLLNVYLVGGLAGGLLYILAFNLIPALYEEKNFLGDQDLILYMSLALGASASVMAIVFATAFYRPNEKMNLMFIGEVKLLHIAYFAAFLDITFIFSGENAGGHIAHLGGAALGWIYAIQYKKGNNILLGFERFMDRFFSFFTGKKTKRRAKMTVNYGGKNSKANQSKPQARPNETDEISYNARKKAHQDKIDKILDKISKSGYESLSKDEKETLFKEKRK